MPALTLIYILERALFVQNNGDKFCFQCLGRPRLPERKPQTYNSVKGFAVATRGEGGPLGVYLFVSGVVVLVVVTYFRPFNVNIIYG